ncbi:MAG TPA: response regulator [Spirochaetia bacterium]|nr:response regulator [Spirochaetia bacterium]
MKRILLIEDDQLITNLIVILLEREGYEVITSPSAEAGLALATGRPPDLVLMDIALPGMDGLEATRILKTRDATRAIPVVALTAQARKEDAEKARRAGCDGFIAKPLSTRDFLTEVAGHIRGARPGKE